MPRPRLAAVLAIRIRSPPIRHWRGVSSRRKSIRYDEAACWLYIAASRGDAQAQLELGMLYESGAGVKRDPVKAVAWYRQSAKQGFTFAYTAIAKAYATGSGVPKDPRLARLWREADGSAGFTVTGREVGALIGLMLAVGTVPIDSGLSEEEKAARDYDREKEKGRERDIKTWREDYERAYQERQERKQRDKANH